MTKRKAATAWAIIALIFLANPNFNLFDPLSDLVAYVIAILLIGKYADLVPYAAEAKSAFVKLAVVNIVKLPAVIIMMTNMSSGTDAAPLFSLIFCVLEIIFLYPAISNTFSALFYLGERDESAKTIQPFILFGKKDGEKQIRMAPDTLRLLSYVFVTVKSALFFLPDLCLLTFTEDTLTARLRLAYPILVVASLLTVLLFGALWAFLAARYAIAIKRGGSLQGAATSLASTDRLAEIERERITKTKIAALTMLAISSLFLFEVSFSGVFSGVSLLPHAVYYTLLFISAIRLFDRGIKRTLALVMLPIGAVLSVCTMLLSVNFYSKYELRDILDLADAAAAYGKVRLVCSLEGIFVVAALLILTLCFFDFAAKNTGFAVSDAYNKREAKRNLTGIRVKGAALFGYAALIVILKCLDVYLHGEVRLIFSDITDVTKPVIAATPLSWLSTAIALLCCGFVLYSLYFLSSVKEEVRMKYSDEESRG